MFTMAEAIAARDRAFSGSANMRMKDNKEKLLVFSFWCANFVG